MHIASQIECQQKILNTRSCKLTWSVISSNWLPPIVELLKFFHDIVHMTIIVMGCQVVNPAAQLFAGLDKELYLFVKMGAECAQPTSKKGSNQSVRPPAGAGLTRTLSG